MNAPTISVIMPVYNAEKYVAEAIESILNQTFKDFEFIIINDCSKDKSLEVIKIYTDNRIRIINNESNKKLSYSLNLGICEAKGKYIARMDADDISLPDRFKTQFEFMERNPKTDICGGNIIEFSDNIERKIIYPKDYDEIKVFMCLGLCSIAHPTVFARKNVFIDNGFYYKEGIVHEDIELWFRMLQEGIIFSNIDSLLLKYRKNNPNQITEKHKPEQIEMELGIFAQGLKLIFSREIDDELLNSYLSIFKNKKKAIQYLLNSIKVYRLVRQLKKENKKTHFADEKTFDKIVSNFLPWNTFYRFIKGEALPFFGIK